MDSTSNSTSSREGNGYIELENAFRRGAVAVGQRTTDRSASLPIPGRHIHYTRSDFAADGQMTFESCSTYPTASQPPIRATGLSIASS
jgi:hypothetical protein